MSTFTPRSEPRKVTDDDMAGEIAYVFSQGKAEEGRSLIAAALSAARREERERLEAQWARMIEAHRQSALSWEKSARELDSALVAATGCEPRYDHGHNDEAEIAF